ncbi:hypothetical protein V1288_000799 [Bradyrhizobium sp. AZCC 2176]
MLNGNRLLGFVDVGNLLVGEQVHDRMINAVEQALFDFDGRQRADNTLRYRPQVVGNVRLIGCIISIKHDLPVPGDQQAVLLVAPDGLYQPGERTGLHPLLFGG